MKQINKLTLSLLTLCCALPLQSFAKSNSLPNLVVIMADDLGLGDVSAYHRQYAKTPVVAEPPNIDALAAQWMSFMDGHSPTALCAPTRYSLMRGNLTYRGYTRWGGVEFV